MGKKITLAQLKASQAAGTTPTGGEADPEKANLIADDLTVTVTRPDGTIVAQGEAAPRGFKQNSKGGLVGWYLSFGRRDPDDKDVRLDLGAYNGLPISGQVMLYVDGIKFGPGDTLDANAAGADDSE